MKLIEIFGNAKGSIRITANTSKVFEAEAVIGDKLYTFAADMVDIREDRWHVTFFDDTGATHNTGTGNSIKVFSCAVLFFEMLIKQKRPKIVEFEAAAGRADLYAKILKSNNNFGYNVHEVNTARARTFRLTKD